MIPVEKNKHQEKITFLEKLLRLLEIAIVLFAMFISFVLLVAYGIIIISRNQELSKTLYLPIKETIILIHHNWIIVIPILLLMFHHPISQLIIKIEEITTPFGGFKTTATPPVASAKTIIPEEKTQQQIEME